MEGTPNDEMYGGSDGGSFHLWINLLSMDGRIQQLNATNIRSIMDYATFELAPAERKDIPRLVHIYFLAYLPDNLFRLCVSNLTEFEKGMTRMLERQVGKPTRQHVKVMDKKTGVLAAWASWNMPTDAQIRERDEKAAAKIADSGEGKGKGELDIFPAISNYVQADIDRWHGQCTS